MKKEFNLGWGESVAVRDAFLETLSGAPIEFDLDVLSKMGYPKHEGDPALVELTKKIIKRQTGNDYQYVLITNGATGGVTISLRACHTLGSNECVTDPAPYFRLYPDMIASSGLRHSMGDPTPEAYGPITRLIDSPSNPLGRFSDAKKRLNSIVIWDTVYFNRVYCSPDIKYPQPQHDILVGSYSKFTGLNGLRVGWIATNDGLLYERLKILVTAEYCGISSASTRIIMETAGKFTEKHWESFERGANFWLDYNRGEWSKLEKFFGNVSVLPVGMFYYAPIDKHCKKLLEKSNIIWSPGGQLGTSDDFGRFNVGQDSRLIKEAVKAVLKNDKR